MSTTLLFIELLIAGLQSTVWIFLLIASFTGYSWLQNIQLQKVSDWAFLITIFVFSFVYVLGIMVDRLADIIFQRWNKRIGKRILPNATRPISVMRFELGKENEYLNSQFEYTRSRMRIARSASFNFALITICTVIFILSQQGLSTEQKWQYAFLVLVIGGLLIGVSIYTWRELSKKYFQLVKWNYRE